MLLIIVFRGNSGWLNVTDNSFPCAFWSNVTENSDLVDLKKVRPCLVTFGEYKNSILCEDFA